MEQIKPILTGHLFTQVRTQLVSLLESLNDPEWTLPTAAPKWNVKDVALHILGGDIGNLSRRRDQFSLPADLSSYEKLVTFINEINATWVVAGQRMSPRVLIDLTRHIGPQADEYFASLEPFAMGGPVSWAGHEPMPQWFDVAREYTERWHHQQQIRDATRRPGLYEKRLFEPVLDTFVLALPYTFRSVPADEGTRLQLKVTGSLEKSWWLRRNSEQWELSENADGAPDATVAIAAENAWKIFTRGLRDNAAEKCAEIQGDRMLGQQVLQMVSVIA